MRSVVSQSAELATGFFHWWLGELAKAVPGPVRRVLAGGASVVSFRIVGDELIVKRAAGSQMAEIGRLDMQRLAGDMRASILTLLRNRTRRSDEILLELEPDQALRKTLDLPLAAENGLAELLWFELDRQTPYRPEQARYDYRILERDGARHRLKVELLVVPLEVVERIESCAMDWGLEPSIVTVADIDDPADPAFDLSGEQRVQRSGPGRLAVVLLAFLAIASVTAGAWMPLEEQRRAALEAEATLDEARMAALAAADLHEELDRRAKAGSFLVRRKNEAPMMAAILADLTRLLPDNAWLFELHFRGREVRVRGYAPTASNVLELVERGPTFRNARFTSPVTRVPDIDAERFDLTFELASDGGNDS